MSLDGNGCLEWRSREVRLDSEHEGEHSRVGDEQLRLGDEQLRLDLTRDRLGGNRCCFLLRPARVQAFGVG